MRIFEGSVYCDGPCALSCTRRVSTGSDWWTVKSDRANRKISTELKNCCSGHLSKCIKERKMWKTVALGLQRPDNFWWWQGSNDDLEEEWRKKWALEMRRSRQLRSQGTEWGISVVNSTEIDKRGNAEQKMELQPSVNEDMGSRGSQAAEPQ